MVTLMQCAVKRVAVFTTSSKTWNPVPYTAERPFTLVLQEQQAFKGAMNTLSICIYQGSQLFLHASQGLKIYKRRPDLAVKYWDIQTNQWCKVQVTPDATTAFDDCIRFCTAAVGVEVVNKENENRVAGKTVIPADDAEFRNYLFSRMKDPEFVLLVSWY